ncbi:MAG: hypothetical protein AB7Q00_06030 [Phycisphaerales bacterium]
MPTERSWFRLLDALLRGESTRDPVGLTERLPLRRFTLLGVGLGVAYGVFMGLYAVTWWWGTAGAVDGWKQLAAGALKLPALFFLTLLVTFPSLYVFSALMGTRLGFLATLRVLVSGIVVNMCVAASLGPIVGFFTLSTNDYSFMVLLNVIALGVAGLVGMGFLLRTMRSLGRGDGRLAWESHPDVPGEMSHGAAGNGPPPLNTVTVPGASNGRGGVMGMFVIWMFIYGLVGSQMGWILRPFIGHPNMPFVLFRAAEDGRTGSFFEALFQTLGRLLGVN